MTKKRNYHPRKVAPISPYGRRLVISRLKDGDSIASIARDIGQSTEVVRAIGRKEGILDPPVARK